MEENKVLWQKVLRVKKESLPEFMDLVSEQRSGYSQFYAKNIFEMPDHFLVLIEEFGWNEYPYLENKITTCKWVIK